MTNQQSFRAYVQAYAAKDLAAIERMFAEEITLCDWNLRVTGKTAALSETRKNFEAASTIVIEVLALYDHVDGIAGELRITVDGTTELRVVDVLDFNSDGQIAAIRAYLGKL